MISSFQENPNVDDPKKIFLPHNIIHNFEEEIIKINKSPTEALVEMEITIEKLELFKYLCQFILKRQKLFSKKLENRNFGVDESFMSSVLHDLEVFEDNSKQHFISLLPLLCNSQIPSHLKTKNKNNLPLEEKETTTEKKKKMISSSTGDLKINPSSPSPSFRKKKSSLTKSNNTIPLSSSSKYNSPLSKISPLSSKIVKSSSVKPSSTSSRTSIPTIEFVSDTSSPRLDSKESRVTPSQSIPISFLSEEDEEEQNNEKVKKNDEIQLLQHSDSNSESIGENKEKDAFKMPFPVETRDAVPVSSGSSRMSEVISNMFNHNIHFLQKSNELPRKHLHTPNDHIEVTESTEIKKKETEKPQISVRSDDLKEPSFGVSIANSPSEEDMMSTHEIIFLYVQKFKLERQLFKINCILNQKEANLENNERKDNKFDKLLLKLELNKKQQKERKKALSQFSLFQRFVIYANFTTLQKEIFQLTSLHDNSYTFLLCFLIKVLTFLNHSQLKLKYHEFVSYFSSLIDSVPQLPLYEPLLKQLRELIKNF